MPNKKLLILLLTLIVAIGVFAQFASFRFLSTQGVLDGDIENIIVPGKMAYVSGFNVYTNLSNFTATEFQYIAGVPFTDYLIGAKGDFSSIHYAILSASNNWVTDTVTDTIITTHTDSDGDNVYDVLNENNTHIYNKQLVYNDDNYFAFAYGEAEDTRFGFAYSFDNSVLENFEDTIQHDVNSSITSGNIIDSTYREFSYFTTNGEKNQDFLLSIYVPSDEMEFGVNVHYTAGITYFEENSVDSAYNDLAPSLDNNYWSGTDITNLNTTINQNIYGGDIEITKEDEDYTGIFVMGYDFVHQPRTYDLYEDTVSHFYQITPWSIGPDTFDFIDSIYTQDTTNTYYEGSQHIITTGIIFIKKLEKVEFGMGVNYALNIQNSTTMEHYRTHYIEVYNDGNGVDDGGDYTYTETSTFTMETQDNSVTHIFNFPVGLEFNMTKDVVFRMGSNTNLNYTNSFHSEKFSNVEPGVWNYIDATGLETNGILENPTQRTDMEYEEHGYVKTTTYNYGIGWQISENMTLDLMGFGPFLFSLNAWQASVNIKF